MMDALRSVNPLDSENVNGRSALKGRTGKDTVLGRTPLVSVREKNFQQPASTRKPLSSLKNTTRQKPEPSAKSQQETVRKQQEGVPRLKKHLGKTKVAVTPQEDAHCEVENIDVFDPLKMELEELPYTTPDYIAVLKHWVPRLSIPQPTPSEEVKDDILKDYSYEPVISRPSDQKVHEVWTLPFDVPPMPEIPDLDML